MRPIHVLAVLLLTTSLAACGQPDEHGEEARAAVRAPGTPEEALLWVRAAAQSGDETVLRERLAAWPIESEAFRRAEETRVALTWRIRQALQTGDVEEAVRQNALLRQDFEGRGESPEGRVLTPRMLRLGIFEEALLQGRRRMEGTRPRPAAAKAALDLAEGLLADGDEVDRARLTKLRCLVETDDAQSVLAHARVELRAAPRGPGKSPPWIVAFADDFALGEVLFTEVLGRWQREGEEAGLRIEIVPVLRGHVRVGIRRMPADSVEEELASMRARIDAAGLFLAGSTPQSRLADLSATHGQPGVGREALEALGLDPQELLVLLIDARGRIVARLAGKQPELRDLDPVLQRLISR